MDEQPKHRNVLLGSRWTHLCLHINQNSIHSSRFWRQRDSGLFIPHSHHKPAEGTQAKLFHFLKLSCLNNKMSTIASLCAGCCLLILSSSLFCGGWKAENYIFQAPLVNRVLVWILPMPDIHADLEGREEERYSLPSACSRWPHRRTVSMMFAVT